MVTFIEFKNGAINYLDKELVSKLTNPLTKMGALSSIYVLDKKATNIYNTLKEHKVIKALEIIDNDGNIDDELLFEALKNGMKEPISFDTGILGTITIHPSDIDKLKECIRTREVQLL